MKRFIAIAALLLATAPVQAKTPSVAQIRQANDVLELALKAAQRKDWKTACIKYKAYGQMKEKTGGFNFKPVHGSAELQAAQRTFNERTAKANALHNSNGSFLCGEAGMTWTNRSMPTAPVVSQGSSVNSNIRNHCEREWGTNYRMVKYCVDQQTTAARSLGY